MERHLRRSNAAVAAKVGALREEVGREFGLLSRVVSAVAGPVLLWSARREERRLAAGHTYEPSPIIERRNWLGSEVPEPRVPALGTLAAQEE